eukprot:c7911_g1_i1.p1 GENE.c7911_g1_i1~~c7911_g1_i1.p1  ORF type:complete len:400 (-),score=87.78 c7911_g1_i1:136-1335(-)
MAAPVPTATTANNLMAQADRIHMKPITPEAVQLLRQAASAISETVRSSTSPQTPPPARPAMMPTALAGGAQPLTQTNKSLFTTSPTAFPSTIPGANRTANGRPAQMLRQQLSATQGSSWPTTSPLQRRTGTGDSDLRESDSQDDNWQNESGRKRMLSQDRQTKGLSLFSKMVCEKVEQKRRTTYNEVSDELVREFCQCIDEGGKPMDEKNIRRRIYDALNVLIALDIIHKDRKQIIWKGLPGRNVEELESLQERKAEAERVVKQKTAHLRDLVATEVAYRSIMNRNQEDPNLMKNAYKVHMPFIVVNTDSQTKIFCEMKSDREKMFFNFDKPFEIHEDMEVLRWITGDAVPPNLHEVLEVRLLPFAPSPAATSSAPATSSDVQPMSTGTFATSQQSSHQ